MPNSLLALMPYALIPGTRRIHSHQRKSITQFLFLFLTHPFYESNAVYFFSLESFTKICCLQKNKEETKEFLIRIEIISYFVAKHF